VVNAVTAFADPLATDAGDAAWQPAERQWQAAVLSLTDATSAAVAMRAETAKIVFDPQYELVKGDNPLSNLYRGTNRRSAVGYVMAGIQVINLGLQAWLLALSLLSIAYQVNESTVKLAITIPVVGMGLLALTGIVMLRIKGSADAAIRRTNTRLGRLSG
jgi:hypothetical protein